MYQMPSWMVPTRSCYRARQRLEKFPVQAVRAMDEVCTGAEKYPLPWGRTRHRLDDNFRNVDEAIAMAVMYTANHMQVSAIIALTESGSDRSLDVAHPFRHSDLRFHAV